MGASLLTAVASVVVGLIAGMGADIFAHLSVFVSVCAGVVTSVAAFTAGALGLTKTLLDIQHRRIEISRARREENLIRIATEAEIGHFGGASYQRIIKGARLTVTQQEQLEARPFIVNVKEERPQG